MTALPRLIAGVTNRPPVFWLAAIACCYAAAHLILLPLDVFISWDESIYSSQFTHSVPHIEASPHRAIGMPLVLAPVTSLTGSLPVLRGYVTVVTAVGLFLAFRSWLAVDVRIAQIGALLFASTNLVLVNGHMLMPNLPSGFGVVAAMAYFIRTVEADGWRPRAGLVAALGFVALMRPTDAVFLAGILGVGVLVVGRWRRRALPAILAIGGGLAIGGAAWTIVSVISFGGPLRRLTATSDTADVGRDPLAMQWLAGVAAQFDRAPVSTAAVTLAYLAVFLVLAVVVRKVCGGWPQPKWLLVLVASGGIIVPYYLLLAYAAARYHLPTYGLLAVLAAAALTALARRWDGNVCTAVTGVCVLTVLVYVGGQWQDATKSAYYFERNRDERAEWARVVARNGVQPPCRVAGHQAPGFAYTLRCHTGDNMVSLPNLTLWQDEFKREWPKAQRSGAAFVYIKKGFKTPRTVEGWPHVRLGSEDGEPVHAYFPPGQARTR